MAKYADNEAPAENVMIRHHTSYQELRSISPPSPACSRIVTSRKHPTRKPDTKPQATTDVTELKGSGSAAERRFRAVAMRHQLDRIQRRPGLITGFLGQTGLTLDPKPP
jgi:hypothetical protein